MHRVEQDNGRGEHGVDIHLFQEETECLVPPWLGETQDIVRGIEQDHGRRKHGVDLHRLLTWRQSGPLLGFSRRRQAGFSMRLATAFMKMEQDNGRREHGVDLHFLHGGRVASSFAQRDSQRRSWGGEQGNGPREHGLGLHLFHGDGAEGSRYASPQGQPHADLNRRQQVVQCSARMGYRVAVVVMQLQRSRSSVSITK